MRVFDADMFRIRALLLLSIQISAQLTCELHSISSLFLHFSLNIRDIGKMFSVCPCQPLWLVYVSTICHDSCKLCYACLCIDTMHNVVMLNYRKLWNSPKRLQRRLIRKERRKKGLWLLFNFVINTISVV